MLGIPRKTQLWHRWKSLRNIPFRRKWFVGYDLDGNTYWEFRDHNNPGRLRRQIAHNRPYFLFGKYNVHPMWMQWLQFTRHRAPTLVDLVNDAKRLQRIRILAQHADAKWKSVPLKSETQTEDPRIGSAWSGQPTAPPAEEERTGWGDAPPADSAKDNVQMAFEHAQSQNRQGPKVHRDELGQVTVEHVHKTK